MSKRHSDDYYKSGSSSSSHRRDDYEYQKRSRHHSKYANDSSGSGTSTTSSDESDDYSNKYKSSRKHDTRETSSSSSSSSSHTQKKKPPVGGIQIKLAKPKSANEVKPKIPVASVFAQDSDDEPEEMPKEARMKMRNIGRDTPTSAGPNTFGKTKQGFCHAKRIFEKSVEHAALEAFKD